jgi:hypothetical protein
MIHVTTFVLGAAAGAATLASLRHPPAPQVVYVERPAASSVAATPPSAAASTAASPTFPSPPKGAVAPSSAELLSGSSQLAAERRLLETARAQLVGGEPDHALAVLDSHRAQFPRGVLAEEREALTIQALVRAGRSDEARAKALAFQQRAPDSLFRPAVESAIESISVTEDAR